MKRFSVIVFVLAVWAIFFWVLYDQVPELKSAINKAYKKYFSIEEIFQSLKRVYPNKTQKVSLRKIDNVGYSFYIGQIDYPDTPPINDDLKNSITQVIYKAKFPKSLLINMGIVIINTLAVSSVQYINTPYGEIDLPEFNPDFMTGGGIYSQNFNQMSLIFINKAKLDSLSNILTHELGHHIGSQVTADEWKKYYQLRKIAADTPLNNQIWNLSPKEDFAEVYKYIFTNQPIQTYYGLLSPKNNFIELAGACGNIYSKLRNSYIEKKYGSELQMAIVRLKMGGEDIEKDIENSISSNSELQNCRKRVLLDPESYSTDWRFGTPYYSVVDQSTKNFIIQIIQKLNQDTRYNNQ